MRQLPHIVRLLLCSLLIGGYGAMYAGSIAHDLGHMTESGKHAEQHHGSKMLTGSKLLICATEDAQHLEVACFFCTHAPVFSDDPVVEQIWTPATASLAPPVHFASALQEPSVPLAELRGPPAA